MENRKIEVIQNTSAYIDFIKDLRKAVHETVSDIKRKESLELLRKLVGD